MTAITLKLTDIAFGGDAIGHDQGQAIFVPFGIPGETVSVQLGDRSGRLARGTLLDVLEPSPHRVEAPCPYFGLCGGCHWQHIAYEQQLVFKEQIVRTQLERIGGQANAQVRPTLRMAEPWSYRNHVQLQVDQRGQIGFFAHKSHDVVPVGSCGLTHPLIDELWEMLDLDLEGISRVSLRAGLYTQQQMVVFEGTQVPELEVDVPVSCLFQTEEEVVVLAGDSAFEEKLNSIPFRISGPSFFQVNTTQAERMVTLVAESLALSPEETLLDAYCGVGVFGLSLAHSAALVLGIEDSPWAIRDAAENADRLGIDHMELYQAGVEEVLPELEERFDAAVLDPPRSGCEPLVLEALAKGQVERLAYVSCDPASLARDVARLSALGYRLRHVQPVDMFPQTFHVECVALLERERD